MTILKEFSYPENRQRIYIYLNTALSSLSAVFLFTDAVLCLKRHLPYYPLLQVAMITALSGLFLGNLAGRLLFHLAQNHRPVYITSEVLYILFASACLLRVPLTGMAEPYTGIFLVSPVILPLTGACIFFLLGIKTCYIMKISCGDFIDGRQTIGGFTGIAMLGIPAGMALAGWAYMKGIPPFYASAFTVLLLPLAVLSTLPYNPSPLYSKNFEEDPLPGEKESPEKDNLYFTYLNFSYIIIYSYLGYITVLRHYGALLHIKLAFIAVLSLSLLAGYMPGLFVRKKNLHVYTETGFPVLSLLFVFLLHQTHSMYGFAFGIALFIPAGILFGFSISQSIKTTVARYSHRKRFNIINLAFLILPVPVIISLTFIYFTGTFFFILIYTLSLLNLLLPGLYLMNRQTPVYRKALFFAFVLVFIPSIVFLHMFLPVPVKNRVYLARTGGYEGLKNINYNSRYIRENATVTLDGTPVFHASDSIIRNLKRSLVPICLYLDEESPNRQILFIDSTQQFFRNPVIGYYRHSFCLDPLFERNLDYNRLPVSGRQQYVPDNEYLLFYLQRNVNRYTVIADLPNIQDQNRNSYRLSEDYYTLVKKHLAESGIFVQVLNMSDLRREHLLSALMGLEKTYRKHIVYLFSNILVVMSSDREDAFTITGNRMYQLSRFLREHRELDNVFLNEFHVLSHIASDSPEGLAAAVAETAKTGDRTGQTSFNTTFIERFAEVNNHFTESIPRTREQFPFLNSSYRALAYHNRVLTLLKKTEIAEADENYAEETGYLFELKRLTEYRADLRKYILSILSFKEEYYYNAALGLEKSKKWEEARELYSAILSINRNNFDANYRMGILCITLQDLDCSFKYLQNAMKLKKDHPEVLYQMGVLFFSTDKIIDAIDYFKRALHQNLAGASLFHYLGLCYEKLDNLNEAEYYYAKAHLADPNDIVINESIERIKTRKEEERNRWKLTSPKNEFEAEQDEDFPLPINKSAYDIRLEDSETGGK